MNIMELDQKKYLSIIATDLFNYVQYIDRIIDNNSDLTPYTSEKLMDISCTLTQVQNEIHKILTF